MNYELLTTENAPVKMWTKGVPVEADAVYFQTYCGNA